MSIGAILAALSLGIWIYLLLGRGGFWRGVDRDDRSPAFAEPVRWPDVVAVVPARNEADVIGHSLGSLLAQDYPGRFSVVLVDDNSSDGTAGVARAAATARPERLALIGGRPLPGGWTGKLWALEQGVAVAMQSVQPHYLFLTDADIVHRPDALRRLVARAEAGDLALTSLMVELRCRSFAERALIPAFVFFFQMLYPFAWVRRRDRAIAAAAGGCSLVRSDALARAGGIVAIRHAVIDDCALAALLKPHGPIWLGLTRCSRSIRPYPDIADIRRMVARSAYAQLGYSPLILLGTILGLLLTFAAPPLLAIFGTSLAVPTAAAAWLLMAVSFVPTLLFYELSPLWAPALPAIATAYLLFTLDSAWQHLRGRGGMWKGRAQATGTSRQ